MITPTKGRVIILQESAEDSSSLIKLPNPPKKPSRGIIHAVAEEHMQLRVGQEVVFGAFGMTEIKDPDTGMGYVVMDEDNVLAILTVGGNVCDDVDI